MVWVITLLIVGCCVGLFDLFGLGCLFLGGLVVVFRLFGLVCWFIGVWFGVGFVVIVLLVGLIALLWWLFVVYSKLYTLLLRLFCWLVLDV